MKSFLAILTGVIVGAAMFQIAHMFLLRQYGSEDFEFSVLSGVVAAHNTADNTIQISTNNRFSRGDVPEKFQFTYDDATIWGSVEFIFHDGKAIRRKATIGKPIPLPPGTLVRVQQDPVQRTPPRLSYIIFLKQSEL